MTASWIPDPTLLAALLASLLPLSAFALIMILTRADPRLSARLAIGAVALSCLCAVFLLGRHWHLETPIQYTGRWLVSSDIRIPFGFLLDSVSLLMLTLVAVISLLVQVYSLGYMAGDPGFSRYFAFQSLFAWAMMS
ncbi:MAG: NADH-quinone oxidoreductase subunit L, partial [Desulfobacterales bacterium]